MKKIIRIGTRNSPLAVFQAQKVQKLLKKEGYFSHLFKIKSEGDLIQNVPIHALKHVGVFTKKLTNIMLSGEIDMAVHSLKDVPINLPEGIILSAFLKRESFFDSLVYKGSSDFLYDPKIHAVIATGSIRRSAFWKNRYPHHGLIDLRGNINTRLKKLQNSSWKGALFAQVGLERLGILNNFKCLNCKILDWMIPSPGQGIIVVSTLEKKDSINSLIKKLDDIETRLSANIERQFLKTLGGGCISPIGAHAKIKNKIIYFTGMLLSLDGMHKIKKTRIGTNYDLIGFQCAEEILKEGGREILEGIKNNIS
ncbi:hydroxymethylbilane synthase (porphobilinogen deaminase) [Blattabacterium sp. (Blattella germanica) str. Bge]|uniref:hydroxymethylbilane synthase n=1 Tax=Blattabacterium sp. (Blattella germanica) TaxID=624186 RepID=UPI0001BB6273|nr:hydroxymethylbilane synthase [Blattabacterium sp. (Blattella germanica)]ACY40573.1 hydroxymethylbilane synthase (porphobilinogen deaminase) [Blattabacterium sp. (Blattella germanica) str. Bge]